MNNFTKKMKNFFLEKDPSDIAIDIIEGLEGNFKKSKGLHPISINIENILTHIAQKQKKHFNLPVIAISIGGTNCITAFGAVSIENGIKVYEVITRELLHGSYFKNAYEFWNRLISEHIFNWLNKESWIPIGITIALPIVMVSERDGFILKTAKKFVCHELGPIEEEETQAQTTIAESFLNYLKAKGISKKKNSIIVSPNDGFSACLSAYHDPCIVEENTGILILGTGMNICTINRTTFINYEFGQYTGFIPCDYDLAISLGYKLPLTLEMMIAGKGMGYIFKCAIEDIIPFDDRARADLLSIPSKAYTKLLFQCIFENVDFFQVNHDTQIIIHPIAEKFISRLIYYIACSIQGLEIAHEKDILLIPEGSLITKNPQLIESINQETKKINLAIPTEKEHDFGRNPYEIDRTVEGTFYLGLMGN